MNEPEKIDPRELSPLALALYDTEGELASQAVAHSTLSILISVPLVLSLGSTLLGI